MHRRAPTPKHLDALIWVVIAVVAVAIACWTVWAMHQPEVRSMWAPD